MPDIKWIKITTEMFDDEKIRIIEAMPEADTLIVLWIRLICMAGKVNAGGHIFLAPNVPYNDEQLSAVFNRPLNTVRLALETFRRLQMIEIDGNGFISLPNFEKHQNIEGMERVRQLGAARVRKHREKVKLLASKSDVALHSVTVTQQNRIEKNRIEYDEIWNNIKNKLKEKVSGTNYKNWFEDSVCCEIGDDEIVIGVTSEAVASHLEETQTGMIRNVVAQTTSQDLMPRFVLIEKENL